MDQFSQSICWRVAEDLRHQKGEERSPGIWVQFSSVQLISRVLLFVTPWTAVCQASLPSPTPGISVQFSPFQFRRSVMSDSLRSHGLQHARIPCPSQIPGVYSNSCPLSRWYHPAISSSVVPFSPCPQPLQTSGSFPMSQFFTGGGQSIGASASASVLPMNTKDLFPSGWTDWISLQYKGLSRVFYNTTVQKHQFFLVLSFLHSPTLTSIHDHCKIHSLDQMDLCWQSNVSAF